MPHFLLPLLLGSYLTLNGVDVAQTMYGVGTNQIYEANPVLAPLSQHPAVFGAVKMGSTGGIMYSIYRLRETHPKTAYVLAILGVGVESYVTIHNAHELSKIK